MRLLECEAKKILNDHGVRTPTGSLVKAREGMDGLDFPVMLKAQIPIGGRGKTGGVIEAAGAWPKPKKKLPPCSKSPSRGLSQGPF